MKRYLYLVGLMPVAAFATTAVSISHNYGVTETLDGYPTTAEIFARVASGANAYPNLAYAVNSSAAPWTTGLPYSEAYTRQASANSGRYPTPSDDQKFSGLGQSGSFRSIIPYEVVRDTIGAWFPLQVACYKSAAEVTSPANLAPSLVSNGCLVFLVSPPVKKDNAWWDPTASELAPSEITPVRPTNQPTVFRGYWNDPDNLVSPDNPANLVTVYTREGFGFSFPRSADGLSIPAARLQGLDLGSNKLPYSRFSYTLFGNGNVSSFRRANGGRDEFFSAFPTAAAGRGYVTYDPAGYASAMSASAGILSQYASPVTINAPYGVWGGPTAAGASAYATFNYPAGAKSITFRSVGFPLDWIFNDTAVSMQMHRFGCVMSQPEWRTHFPVNYWTNMTEIPFDAHGLNREGYYSCVIVPVVTLAKGSGLGSNFTFSTQLESHALWDQARVQKFLVAGCCDYEKITIETEPTDSRYTKFFQHQSFTRTIKLYKDDFARAVRNQYDPSAYYLDSFFKFTFDSRYEELFKQGILKYKVTRQFLRSLNPTDVAPGVAPGVQRFGAADDKIFVWAKTSDPKKSTLTVQMAGICGGAAAGQEQNTLALQMAGRAKTAADFRAPSVEPWRALYNYQMSIKPTRSAVATPALNAP